MAKNLLTKRKHALIVWNRDASKSEALAAEFPGRVTVAATAREVVGTAQVGGWVYGDR
jgi:3-hydroxyisobutyrate dehydrogenase-like beta-hydroxyacid dehydrogenase